MYRVVIGISTPIGQISLLGNIVNALEPTGVACDNRVVLLDAIGKHLVKSMDINYKAFYRVLELFHESESQVI